MAADSTVNIDVILHKEQAQETAKEIDQALKNIGEGAGDKAEQSIKDSTDKAIDDAKDAHAKIDNELKKPVKTKVDADIDDANAKVDEFKEKTVRIPKKVRTELISQAEIQGIENFDKLLKQLPKEQKTELVAKVQKGEVINYEEELRKVPANVLTKLELNDKASPTLQKLQAEADTTERKFTSLKDIIKGTFVGSLLATGANSIIGYLHGIAGEAIATSDAMYKFKQTMKLGGYGEEEIAKASKEVKKYADETVYDLSDITNTSAQLASNGIKGYQRLTEAAGNLNAQAGGNAETFKSVAMVMTQTAGAGKLTTENWNQLTDAIAGASGPLQKAMKDNGAYTGNFRDAMANGQITANELFDAIEKLGTTKGAEEAAKSTETFEGAVGNLEAQIITTMDKVIDQIGKKRITNAINGVTKLVANLTEGLVNVFDVMASHTGVARTLLGVMVGIFATKRIFNFISALGEAKLAMMAFNQTAGANPLTSKVPQNGPKTVADTAVDAGKTVAGGSVRGMLRAVGSRAVRAAPYAAGAVMAGTELFSNNSASEKTGGILGAMGGAVGGKALGAAIGTMIAPGIGTTVGGILGGTVGSWAGNKLGEAIGKGADEHLKAHPITVKTKYKTSTDNKAMDKDLTPSINKVNKTVLKMDVDSASIQKAQQKTDKYFDEMSKKIDSYYKKKADGYKKDEEASKKNLDALVKNGKMTQAEEDKALKKQQENDQKKIKSDDAAAKQRKKVLEQMRKDTNDYYAKVSKIENDANKSEKQKQKELQKAQAAYVKKQYKDQLDANKKITSYVKQGANTQEKIYEQLVKKRGQLDMKDLKATQKAANQKYNAAVKPAKKARNEIVNEAYKEYKDTTKTAEKEYKEHHTISKKKYKEIVANAYAQYKGVSKAADDEYNKTTKKASDEHKKVTGEVNKQKDEVIAAANNQAMSHGAAAGQEYTLVNANVQSGQKKTAGTMNGFIKSLNSFFKALSANVTVPMISGYAVGTGALPHNQLAMVGEEGPELAHTPQGYEMLGMNGPELRYLSAGTSILTNAQTKTALALNGGKIPGYAKGTGAKIEDFVSGALDKADDALDAALDLVGKGAEEIWSWFKKKLGIDRAVASVDPKWLMQLQSKQETEIGGKAGSSFLKKALDKFLESFSGGQGKMSKGAFAQAAKVAAALMHQSLSASDIERLYWQAMVESTVNPAQGGGIDDHDGTGRPIGLFQFKLGTWGAAVRHLPSGHSNIHSAVDQIMAVLADRTWRSDLAPIGVRRGWSPHGYANGGWADKLSIFGEVPGEPEVAINPARDTSEEHIAEAIEARAKVNPNGFAGNLSKIINEAKRSANNLLPVINSGNNHVKTVSNVQSSRPRIDGNITLTMNIDGKQLSRAVYPTLKAMRSHEVIINGVGGAVPVGNGQPLGGVY
ncbi:tape measure protein [Limosilactobacillus reuteri]|uniref:tape measure protein n=1 Tax=Limosilactobacillus reuteri TaxID=1598 RepID=UPI00143DB2C1|nr:tape measure protein [Limosilactobacillus reuteri]QIZ05232.1 tape measure protein [Limosilactobacillus reuteri]